MRFFGNPADPFISYGPPTRFQPQWSGQGYKHQVFDSALVAHVIAPDGVQHQMISVYPEHAHLPVEHALLDYFASTGGNPAEFALPEHQSAWDYIGQQFGIPDSRPGSLAVLPRQQQAFGFNPFDLGMGVPGAVRNPDEASMPRRGR